MTTKNGDMPAIPFEAVMARSNGITTAWTNYTGLTKREMIAMHMMAAITSAAVSNGLATADSDASGIAMAAVFAADALLAELERTK